MLLGNSIASTGEVPNGACFGRAKVITVSDKRLVLGKPDLMVKRRHTDTFTCRATLWTNLFSFGECIWPAAIRHTILGVIEKPG